MTDRPRIGVTGHIDKENTRLSISADYMEALYALGALPILLPMTGDEGILLQIARELDGFLFSGGGDIAPSRFGEETFTFCGEISPARDEMELGLFHAVLPTQKPILGICRGVQLVNVAMGGTLFQDIYQQNAQPYPQQHRQTSPDRLPAHDVLIEENSLLHRIVGKTRLPVNTLHHQAVKDCGKGLAVTARSVSGLIEAVEKQDHPFFLGVQWHPERMFPADESAKKIFAAFLDACAAE